MSVALVTGANRVPGIGYEIARGLALRLPEGSKVILTAREPEMGLEAVAKLKEEVKGRVEVLFHQLDIAESKSVEALEPFVSKLGGLDVLVNNAGLAFPLNDSTPFHEQARRSVDVNYYGTKRMLALKLKPGARVIGISSSAGALSGWSPEFRQRLLDASVTELDAVAEEFVEAAAKGAHRESGFPGSAYGTSKTLMTQLHRAMKVDGLLCAVCPGLCRTHMATGRGTFMSNVLWLASFLVGRSAEGGADTPLWLCLEVPTEDFHKYNSCFLRGRQVRGY